MITILLGCLLSLNSEKHNDTLLDYHQYHLGISNAIILALDSNMIDSQKCFEKTFQVYDYKFPRDLLIAAQICVINADTIAAKSYYLEAIRNGVNPDKIKEIPLLDREFLKFNTKTIDSILELRNFESGVLSLIDSLYIVDQNWRNIDQRIFTNKFLLLRKKIRKNWNSFLLNSVSIIDSLSNIYIFPGERIIGISNESSICSPTILLLILYHYENSFTILKSRLDLALKYGYIHVRDYALLCDFERRHCLVKNKCNLYSDYVYGVRWTEFKDTNEITVKRNLERNKIGLFSYEYERKMKIYQNTFNYTRGKSSGYPIDFFYYNF